MSVREYEEWTRDEVAQWPGAAVAFEAGSKHNRAVLTFGEDSRFVVYPSTPGDSTRGIYNKLADVRRELAGMGAVRNEKVKSTRPQSERNPGADMRERAIDPAPVIPDPWEPLRDMQRRPLITTAGAYPDISNEDYHRNADLLPAPSLSSSGAKKLLSQSPFHFWFDSPMNPERPEEGEASHFAIGKAAHDVLLLADRFDRHYHVLPEGFTWNKTKAMPDAIAEAEAAREAGLCLLKHDDMATVQAVADVLAKNPLVCAALKNGVTEETLAWQDEETGVWLRARPDFRSNTILTGGAVRLDVDLKFMASTHCSPSGFARAIGNFGFHQSAAFYADGLKHCHGHAPTNRLHIVVEKEAPHSVSLYELPEEDTARGAWLNRKAIRMFADCLSADRWPAYSDEPSLCGLTGWARRSIDQQIEEEAA